MAIASYPKLPFCEKNLIFKMDTMLHILSLVMYDSGAGRVEAFGWLLPPGGGGECGAAGTGSQCKEESVHPS